MSDEDDGKDELRKQCIGETQQQSIGPTMSLFAGQDRTIHESKDDLMP